MGRTTGPGDDYASSYVNENAGHNIGTDSFLYIGESDQRLRCSDLLVIGCRIKY